MTDVSMQSVGSGWSSFVLVLATTIPLILFWKPLRDSINEYRLYKRCQQYPNIVVYKGNSSAKTSEQKSDDGIIGLVMQIGVGLFRALLSFLRFVMGTFITILTSAINKKETPNTEEPISNSTETEEHAMTSSSDTRNQTQLPPRRPVHHSASKDALNNGAKVQRAQSATQNFIVMRQSEEIFESSSQRTEKVDQPMQNGRHPMVTAPATQERPRSILRKRERSSEHSHSHSHSHSRPSKYDAQTQMVVTTSTLATVPKPFVFDSSSLSEKMRKRRLNGENIMGYNAIASGEGDEGISRKRRKLNVGRMPLQGCVARHPRAGAWQTTKILDKREREEREERLLRSMSRKRVKRTEEAPKLAAPAPASTAAPAASTPAFTFGQTTTAPSTTAPTAKQDASAAVSTPAPAFQFGGNAVAKPKEDAAGGAEKKSEPAAKAPAFSFGNTTTATTTTAATSDKAQAPAPSAPAPAFQFGAPSADAKKDQPAQQQPPTFGAAPASTSTSAAPSAPAAAAPSFAPSTAPPAPSFGAPSAPAAAAPSFGAPSAAAPAPSFGAPSAAPPAPSFGGFSAAPAAPTQAPAPSTFGAPAPAAQGFGATSAPPAFGAVPSQPAKPANTAPFSFGNTKENTNPGGFNGKFQAAAPSNGFSKPQPTNIPAAGFGGSNFGGMPGGFSAGAAPPAATTGASARRMARRARSRRR